MIMTIIASGKREFILRTSCVPATSREAGTVARETVAVLWWFRSMEGFKSLVSSVGASDVLGKEYRKRERLYLSFTVSGHTCPVSTLMSQCTLTG